MFDILETPADLSPWVQCIWTMRSCASETAAPPIAPDGCCEWIVHLGDPPRVWRDNAWTAQPRTFVFGQLRGPLVLHNERDLHVLAVRLRAHAASALLHVAGRDLIEHELPVADLVRSGIAGRQLGAFESLASAYPRMIALLRSLAARARTFDSLAVAATAAFDQSPGMQRVDALARHLAVSPRTLERRFVDAVGLSPKRYARIRRMQLSLEAIGSRRYSLAAIAAFSGYADQAHMTRELVDLAGSGPRRLALEGGLACGGAQPACA